MSAKVSYQIEFKGLDENIIKLTRLEGLLNSIGRHGGIIGGQGGSGNGSGNNTNFIGVPPSSGAGASVAREGVGAGEAAAIGAASGNLTSFGGRLKISSDKLAQELDKSYEKLDKTIKNWQNDQFGLDSKPRANHRGHTAATAANHDKNQAEQFGLMYQQVKPGLYRPWGNYPNAIGPQINPNYAIGGQGFNSPIGPQIPNLWKQLVAKGNGGLSDLGKGGSGTGAGAVFGGGLIGGLVDKFGVLKVATATLAAAFVALEVFLKTVKDGAEAYQRGARFGQSVGSQFQLDQASKAIGVDIDTSQLQGQFNKKSNKFDAPGTDEILGAARIGQLGNAQQLLNMAEQFKEVMSDSANSARQMQTASGATMQLSIDISAITREWKTMLTQMVAALEPVLHLFTLTIKNVFEAINGRLESLTKILQLLHLIPQDSSNIKHNELGGIGARGQNISSLEKIGFSFRGQHSNSLSNIDKNTRDTVGAITKLATEIGKIVVGAAVGAGTVPFPAMP